MAGTGVWLMFRDAATEGRITDAARRPDRSGRAAVRLWVLLRAQGLLCGPAGGRDVVTGIEDDYRRLAARRQA